MALRQKVANRHEIQQHDREAESRQVRRPTSAPADAPRREDFERVHRPANECDEDLGIVQRHRLHARVSRRVGAGLSREQSASD